MLMMKSNPYFEAEKTDEDNVLLSPQFITKSLKAFSLFMGNKDFDLD